ncbi:RNA polymerase sigma-70 factor [Halalkalibaculum sp. DA3122]|uniref:RNA polymerase sigma-70 factor n=1 Tax=unclassified Halalkalibaculum TaxID=2964617 RepID=UPI0037548174
MSRKKPGKNGEKLLIQRIREGEEYAFEIAFLKYHTPLCRYIWKYVRSEELSKEIVQEVFTDVWDDRKNLSPSGHLRGFLFEIARNKALDYIKHQKIVDRYISEAKKKKREDFFQRIHHRESDDREFIEAVKAEIANLPPRGREIFELNRKEGLTYREISDYLDISIKTVETHMRRTLQKLRDRLSAYIPTLLIYGMVQFLF